MLNLTNHFKFIINDKLYNKNPESTDLGKNIIKTSIVLIEEMGYEQFTFKKLGEAINLTKVLFIDTLKTSIIY